MSILIAKELMCDKCAGWVRLDAPMAKEWPALKREGWTRKAGEHFCNDCSGSHVKTQYCEFHGDTRADRRCEHMGLRTCTLHKEQLKEDAEGWRKCCESCTTPFYEVEK